MDLDAAAGDSPAIGLTRSYKRLPSVEAEIAALPAGTDGGFLAAVAAASAPETLVHAIRRILRAGNGLAALNLAELLVERAAPFMAAAARSQFPRSLEGRQDVIQAVRLQLWRKVQDTSAAEEFWEVNFRHMVIRACSDAAEAIRKPCERPFDWGENAEGEDVDEEGNLADDELMDTDLFVPEALDQLEGDVRRAVYLLTQGYPVSSKKPNVLTIVKLLQVSDRTVRSYIRRARAVLKPWRAAGAVNDTTGRSFDARSNTGGDREGNAS